MVGGKEEVPASLKGLGRRQKDLINLYMYLPFCIGRILCKTTVQLVLVEEER